MKPVITNAHDSVTLSRAPQSDAQPSKFNRELYPILARYGQKALHASYLTLQTDQDQEEVVLVPRMRLMMGEEAWEELGPDFREKVLKLFYERL